jgi:hypothetical protein
MIGEVSWNVFSDNIININRALTIMTGTKYENPGDLPFSFLGTCLISSGRCWMPGFLKTLQNSYLSVRQK